VPHVEPGTACPSGAILLETEYQSICPKYCVLTETNLQDWKCKIVSVNFTNQNFTSVTSSQKENGTVWFKT
jgi:aspartate 1-decarboxylase